MNRTKAQLTLDDTFHPLLLGRSSPLCEGGTKAEGGDGNGDVLVATIYRHEGSGWPWQRVEGKFKLG